MVGFSARGVCGVGFAKTGNNMSTIDKWTGKPVDKASDLLPSSNGEFCDTCKTELIDRCLYCGAPVCCPKCCKDIREKEMQDEYSR